MNNTHIIVTVLMGVNGRTTVLQGFVASFQKLSAHSSNEYEITQNILPISKMSSLFSFFGNMILQEVLIAKMIG